MERCEVRDRTDSLDRRVRDATLLALDTLELPLSDAAEAPATFFKELWNSISTRLPTSTRYLVYSAWTTSTSAVKAARLGRGEESVARLRESRQRAASLPRPGSGRLLAKSMFHAAAAYLDYRRGDWERCRQRLSLAAWTDRELERGAGLKLLSLHRVQLVVNYVRLLARMESEARALGVALLTLDLLEGRSSRVSEFIEIDSRDLSETPSELLHAMKGQLLDEIERILQGIPSPPPELEQSISGRDSGFAQAYLKARAAWLRRDDDTFLEMLPSCVSQLREYCPRGWVRISGDLVALASSSPDLENRSLAARLGSAVPSTCRTERDLEIRGKA